MRQILSWILLHLCACTLSPCLVPKRWLVSQCRVRFPMVGDNSSQAQSSGDQQANPWGSYRWEQPPTFPRLRRAFASVAVFLPTPCRGSDSMMCSPSIHMHKGFVPWGSTNILRLRVLLLAGKGDWLESVSYYGVWNSQILRLTSFILI